MKNDTLDMENELAVTKSVNSKHIKKINEINQRAWKVHNTQPKLGLQLSQEAKKLSEEYQYKQGLAYAIRNLGVSHRYLSNLELALSHSTHALHLFRELDDKSGESQALVSIGAIYYYMGDYDKGLDFFLQGLHEGEKIGNKEAMAYANNGAGYIYGISGQPDKGLNLLNTALGLSREIQNFSLESTTLDSIATIFLSDGQLDKAFQAYTECQKISEKKNDKRNLGYALLGKGEILLQQNKFDEAKHYISQSQHTFESIGYKVGKVNGLYNLGKLSIKQHELEQAISFLKDGLEIAEGIKAKASMYMIHEALAEVYEKKNDFKPFVFHYKLFHKIKSEVYTEELELKQKYQHVQFEVDKLQQEAEINRLTNVVMKEKNAELKEKTKALEKSYRSVTVLSQIGRDITSTLDLDTILNTVYENVNHLMDATVFGIGIYKEKEDTIYYRLSVEEGKRYQPYTRNMSDKTQLAVWCIEHNKEVFINDIEEEYSKYVSDIDLTVLHSAALEDGSAPKNPMSLIYLPLEVKGKTIGLISVQSFEKNQYTEYHLDILKTLAFYTSAALYNAQSYEKLEGTLNELKVTQSQLIQSEKMASLGELTAGIAHEIQNPLNFVNNFSEVSNELLEELLEEVELNNLNEVRAITVDVIQNLKKINEHGQRASSIVKGMLQHSRGSTGQKEMTDINALADEYLRLSYHGLRAKDKSFNASFSLEADKNIPLLEVVPQDIGRVMLNLINNAFYAVSEKSKQNIEGYKPQVIVSTQISTLQGGLMGASISVKDNGPGIPDTLKEKILQPFFTTKPTGSGTGLGLSISFEIVTKGHNGEFTFQSTPNEGTTFIVSLPVNLPPNTLNMKNI